MSKSISSTLTGSIYNGQVHTMGKEVINDSTKPFIQVSEMHNGHLENYMIPREHNKMNQGLQLAEHISSKSKKIKQTKKTKHAKKAKKAKKSKH